MKNIKLLKILASIVFIIVMTLFGTWLLVENNKTYKKSEFTASSQHEIDITFEELDTPLPETINNDKSDKLDINTATKEELDTLEGIGPALADRIIEYRKNKPFKTIYDLKKVSGIGDEKFKDIEDYIIVNR